MAGINNSNEPSSAPQADRWYNLTLGSSFKDHNPSRFCTLRYEFKPASIDKNQRGTLHKGKNNKVSVEFQNIQPGKPKMTFEGTSEDYKDNDAVLFFDGESFRLERLHRAVKRLRHNRLLGESTGAVAAPAGLSDVSPPPVGKGIRHQPLNKEIFPAVPVEVERIEIGDFKNSAPKPRQDKTVVQANSSNPSPDLKNDEEEEHLDIMNDDEDDVNAAADEGNRVLVVKEDFDINMLPQQNEMDDEIADVDVSASDDEADKGRNAAEELRAQVNAEERQGQTSSSSGSSGSESSGSESGSGSGSGSGSSSSDSESSDGESVSV
ncbi:Protein associated with transcriptional elongation factor ELL [Handroanthus impetiginosus]|uniref:Protein associated with transcriptional elongation factor ELL n=1 Tax=Handroanthus impetiginosus TaxID=429701 RepID=A0A2G9HBS2_9LAMI|nr:Protein associated with transcriptional elongation factor ELL [Handroanthus impetiginosus]